jgi:alcohol dehydrogenase
MKAAVLAQPGLAHLRIVERPDPVAGPGEVLVRLRAASLNFRDPLVVDGGYGSLQRMHDLIPLSDGAGEIAALGEGVSRWRYGDRVMGSFFPGWEDGAPTAENFARTLGGTHDGVACELRVFGEHEIAAIPSHLSFEEASTLPCAGVTAWSALFGQSTLVPGSTVVTQGSGGVSLFALALARKAGCRVIATSSSPQKLRRLRELGCDEGVDYRAQPQWARAVKELTGQRGAAHVVDVGGEATLPQSVKAVAVGGTVSLVGVLSGSAPALPLPLVVIQNIRLQGVTVGSTRMLRDLARFCEQHALRPVIDRVFPLEGLQDAIAHLRAGSHFGKVCIQI